MAVHGKRDVESGTRSHCDLQVGLVRASHKVLESSPKVSVLLAELSKHGAAEKGISLKPALLGHGSDQQPKDAISFRMIHSEIQSRCGKLDL